MTNLGPSVPTELVAFRNNHYNKILGVPSALKQTKSKQLLFLASKSKVMNLCYTACLVQVDVECEILLVNE